MWFLTAVAAAAFVGNLGAEIMAEGVADFTRQMYTDWFWSFEPERTLADVTRHYDEVQSLITEAELRLFQAPAVQPPAPR